MSEMVKDLLTEDFMNSVGLSNSLKFKILRCFDRDITKNQFIDLSIDEIANKRGIGIERQSQIIWLQKYFKGEVNGIYPRQYEPSIENYMLQNKLATQMRVNNELREKNDLLKKEISEIKQENRQLRKFAKMIDEMKEFLMRCDNE